MTENETIKIIKRLVGISPSESIVRAVNIATEALEEIQQYRAIGTVEEIKEILQIISEGQDDVDESGISTGLLKMLLKYVEYAKIGTVEECRKAEEKQKAKKPVLHQDTNRADCPVCGNTVRGIDKPFGNWCSHCGQKLNWSE